VSKSFGGRRVLKSASLRAVPGEVRALLGRSGEGKSTLLRIAAGWLAPDSGVVLSEGEGLLHTSPAMLARRGVYYLPDSGSLSRSLTLARQLAMIAEQFPNGESPRSALERLGVGRFIGSTLSPMSGGEQRRAEVAAVFVRRPKVLLADEPLRGIAPIDQEHIMAAFRELADSGTAVVVTGHDVEALLDGATHVTWSTSGTTYELGAPSVARENEQFRREYLGR